MRILLDGNSPFTRGGGRSPGPLVAPPPVVIWFIILGVRRGPPDAPLLELRELEFRGVKPLLLPPAEDALAF